MNTVQKTPSYLGMVFGIELEIEAEGLYQPVEIVNEDGDIMLTQPAGLPSGWSLEQEDSIKGVELICDQPYELHTLVDNINRLYQDIGKQGFMPGRTPRGSTHVHVNAADLTWEQMRSFVMACVWAEPFLIEHAGTGRKGNLFAQSYEHTPLGWTAITQWCRHRLIRPSLDTHYMATSFSPLGYLGSVEFRMGPSSRTAEEAIDWLCKIAVVAQAGRNEFIDDREPAFIKELLFGLPEYTINRLRHKAKRHATQLWQDLNEPVKIEKRSPRKKVVAEPLPPISDEVYATNIENVVTTMSLEDAMNLWQTPPTTCTTNEFPLNWAYTTLPTVGEE